MTYPPCTLTVLNGIADWCDECQRYHAGHHRKWALGEDEESQKKRKLWKRLLAGEPLQETKSAEGYLPLTPLQMVTSYVAARAKHIAGGSVLVPDSVEAYRREKCNQCLYRDPVRDACKICGCNLSPSELEATLIGDKLRWAVASCPVSEWGEWPESWIESKASGNYGVVIGSYGMPGVVDLNIAMIRKTCGDDTPILIADDNTPKALGRQRLIDMPNKYPNVSLVMTGENLGHAPGDIRAYRNGLRWASRHKINYICKLSQRFIILKTGWMKEVCEEMKQGGHATASQRAVHLNMQFAIRSECVFMDVKQCAANGLLMNHLNPSDGKISTSAEDWLAAGINEAGLVPVMRCRLMPVDRFSRSPNLLWHNTHGQDNYEDDGGEAYRDLAKEMGIDLGAEFSASGWHVIAPHRPEANYKML